MDKAIQTMIDNLHKNTGKSLEQCEYAIFDWRES